MARPFGSGLKPIEDRSEIKTKAFLISITFEGMTADDCD